MESTTLDVIPELKDIIIISCPQCGEVLKGNNETKIRMYCLKCQTPLYNHDNIPDNLSINEYQEYVETYEKGMDALHLMCQNITNHLMNCIIAALHDRNISFPLTSDFTPDIFSDIIERFYTVPEFKCLKIDIISESPPCISVSYVTRDEDVVIIEKMDLGLNDRHNTVMRFLYPHIKDIPTHLCNNFSFINNMLIIENEEITLNLETPSNISYEDIIMSLKELNSRRKANITFN